MPCTFTYDVPITDEIYARINEGLGQERPPDLSTQVAWRTETGPCYLTVRSGTGQAACIFDRHHQAPESATVPIMYRRDQR
jgi:hypothetical protein